jgi:hypothetical protein
MVQGQVRMLKKGQVTGPGAATIRQAKGAVASVIARVLLQKVRAQAKADAKRHYRAR